MSPDHGRPTIWPTRDLAACLLCGNRRLRPESFVYSFGNALFPAVRCSACGFVFLSRQPIEESFPHLYDAQYFEADYHCGHEERSYFATEAEQTTSSAELLSMIERVIEPGRILEIGSAGGYFLAAARERGWSAIGIEVSDEAARHARETLGLDVRTGSLDSVRLEPESFNAAYMGDVLEHVPDPMDTLRRTHELLKPGGVLLLAGPITINSLDRRLGLAAYHLLRARKVLNQPPYHLTEFTPRTLRFALERTGFSVRFLKESKIPPLLRNVRRRSLVEHAAKFLLDVPNWLITRGTGRLGDRVLGLAMKPGLSLNDAHHAA